MIDEFIMQFATLVEDRLHMLRQDAMASIGANDVQALKDKNQIEAIEWARGQAEALWKRMREDG